MIKGKLFNSTGNMSDQGGYVASVSNYVSIMTGIERISKEDIFKRYK